MIWLISTTIQPLHVGPVHTSNLAKDAMNKKYMNLVKGGGNQSDTRERIPIQQKGCWKKNQIRFVIWFQPRSLEFGSTAKRDSLRQVESTSLRTTCWWSTCNGAQTRRGMPSRRTIQPREQRRRIPWTCLPRTSWRTAWETRRIPTATSDFWLRPMPRGETREVNACLRMYVSKPFWTMDTKMYDVWFFLATYLASKFEVSLTLCLSISLLSRVEKKKKNEKKIDLTFD